MKKISITIFILLLLLLSALPGKFSSVAAQTAEQIKVDWQKVERVSRTTLSLQVVVMPPLRRGWAFALRRDFPHLQFSVNGQARTMTIFTSRAVCCH